MPSVKIAALAWLAALSPISAFAAEIDFAHDIVPILRKHCGGCHTGDKKQGGFSMNTRAALLAGGENGAPIVLKKSAESDLIQRLKSADANLRMPPEGDPLPDKEIALLAAWIDAGLPWEQGFAFKQAGYEPPLRPRRVELPAAQGDRDNPIDRIIDAYLSAQQRQPPAEISDAEFYRRLSLDVVGLLPDPEQLEAFLADTRPDKRTLLVQELLADDVAYAEHWLTFWNDLLRNDYTGTGFITGGRKQITNWLYRSLIDNKPYDQFVRELIAPTAESEGFIQGIRWRGEVNSSQTNEIQFAQSISQSLLGINLKCASCHDSFIDRWKLEESYRLAAIYSAAPLAIHRCDKPTGATATPGWLFPELGEIQADASQPERLKQLAALMTHEQNGRFTRTIVNRIWQRLMGRGIVHPVDAMQTAPWNADLLDFLATHLADQHYDLKQTIRLICTSRAYASQMPANDNKSAEVPYEYAGPLPRRMTAEQFMDAVWQLTGTAPTRPDAPVLRGRLDSDAQSAAARPLAAQWVWSTAEASAAAPAGETITLRHKFNLPSAPTRAVAGLTCDNEYTLYCNGQRVAADGNWENAEIVALETFLRAGENELVIVAKNGGAGPNPAGLILEARLRLPDESEQAIGSDETWQWTVAVPNGQGKFAEEPADWKPAVPVSNPAVWAGRINPELEQLLSQATFGPPRMVRASLMKCDALMHSLGRPNRDQIVTMRPNDLTTLEAIDLANGQTLADALATGANAILAKHGNTPEGLIEWLYRFALSRAPTSEELSLTREALGPQPDSRAVEDLLWAILMQPEFQLVR
ncbi:MAG: DUF1549 domain-containing protein [Pirellulales bacterium]